MNRSISSDPRLAPFYHFNMLRTGRLMTYGRIGHYKDKGIQPEADK
jgi:hypothetical protein